VYFHSIIDSADCDKNVVDLTLLDADLASIDTTPNLSYIIPGLCSDGHDHTCVDGSEGWMKASNKWLAEWIPKILNSAAFKDNGLLIVTFDEAAITGDGADASSCCGDLPTPNLSTLAGLSGPGGGRATPPDLAHVGPHGRLRRTAPMRPRPRPRTARRRRRVGH
jgi:hypothetical protein